MKFRSWRTAMETKLRASADHCSTPELRKTYVASRLTGAAYDQIVLGLNDDGDEDASFDDGAEFIRLANDAQVPRNKRVKLLHRKLTPKLQHKLVGKASKTATKTTANAKPPTANLSARNQKSTSSAPSSFPRLDVAEMIKRKSEGRSFEYNEVGHMGKHFPKRALRFVTEAKAKALVAVHLSELEAFAPTPPYCEAFRYGENQSRSKSPYQADPRYRC
ncbi:hypothetical protein N7509_000506 [Penicillium cosmopolitanum]|uniref:Uncharacterized protein n=1 Tax=Penicillium cosmopolitanum TaxID=1131564 RepID=A0A9W9WB42_9EURO|nr:uncharacterized protein N7509_000506 [Penicillium cosmopolitanum]KAJ5413879.1 hypothetical protein N7509_000506 [Penicillium cosmopolitanum]